MLVLGSALPTIFEDRVKVPLKPIHDSEDIEKAATMTDREAVRRIRSACKNGLEFVGKMLMKRELFVIIGAVSRFVEHFFSE